MSGKGVKKGAAIPWSNDYMRELQVEANRIRKERPKKEAIVIPPPSDSPMFKFEEEFAEVVAKLEAMPPLDLNNPLAGGLEHIDQSGSLEQKKKGAPKGKDPQKPKQAMKDYYSSRRKSSEGGYDADRSRSNSPVKKGRSFNKRRVK